MLDHSCQVQRHPLSERRQDLYETPTVAVEALLRVEPLPQVIWEPACGPGAIVNVLRAHGHTVIASDLEWYHPEHFSGRDFLMEPLPAGVEAIVTNPPYRLAQQFVEHALHLCPRVVMLLRLAFYESVGRTPILEQPCAPARIHVFRKRLPMMHRDGWTGPKASSAICFAWFVWDLTDENLPTVIDRISWEA